MIDFAGVSIQDFWLDDSLFCSILPKIDKERLLPIIEEYFSAAKGYNKLARESIVARINATGLTCSLQLAPCLGRDSSWRKSRTGEWVMVDLCVQRGDRDAALRYLDQIISQADASVHEALLEKARLEAETEVSNDAYENLRSAVKANDEYRFLSKAATTYARFRRSASHKSDRKAKIAVLSSTTTDLFIPLLRLLCFRDGIDAEIYAAPYGAYQQEILDNRSGLYGFQPDVVIIATNWRDAGLEPFSRAPEEDVRRVVDHFKNLWETLLSRFSCRIIQHGFDLPPTDSYGHLASTLQGGRLQMMRSINLGLCRSAPPSVAVLDTDQVSAVYGKDKWVDEPYWHLAKQHPASDALPLLVNHDVALVRAALGLTKKVLVVDLDNTLWGGIVGEDGLSGIRLGPPTPVGEAFQAFQKYLAELKDRGILLAVCSKNNEEDAREVFKSHDAMILRLEDFVVFKANWLDKPTNLRQIAEVLNLGSDSFVFLDDNPVERALVRKEMPEIAIPELPKDPALYIRALERGGFFEAWTLSKEDRERHDSYNKNALREELRSSSGTLKEFLLGLQMVAEAGEFNETVLPRVVQLIGKTNQFNLTTRRHSEEVVRKMLASEEYWTQYFKLRDRFGDNGLIGLLIARRIPGQSPAWEIDTWLMSCRVIDRQVEQLMLRTLSLAAKARGIQQLHGIYIPTQKNKMVADFYSKCGFKEMARATHDISRWVGALDELEIPSCEFISLQTIQE